MIELLIVIALIGLLMGILIPSLRRSVELAADTMCKNNIREIGTALALYQMDNADWLPDVQKSAGGLRSTRDTEGWFGKLFPTYLTDASLLACPEDPHRYRMIQASSRVHDPLVADYSSYGINGFIMTAGGGALAQVGRIGPTKPHDTILVSDAGPDEAGSTVQVYGITGPARNASVLTWDDGFDPFSKRPATNPWVTTRHGRGVNMLTLGFGVKDARSDLVLKQPLQRYYSDCAAGRCALCTRLRLTHYSFAKDKLYWWTGPTPTTE